MNVRGAEPGLAISSETRCSVASWLMASAARQQQLAPYLVPGGATGRRPSRSFKSTDHLTCAVRGTYLVPLVDRQYGRAAATVVGVKQEEDDWLASLFRNPKIQYDTKLCI